MHRHRIIVALVVATVWMACGSEAPVAVIEAATVGSGQMASLESPGGILYACYKPSDGSVYRIKEVDLEQTCQHDKDVMFSWNEVGPPGPAGADGSPGSDGLACWDLNGNGVGDVPDEDANGDGVVDVLDCKGERGEAGGSGWVDASLGTGYFNAKCEYRVEVDNLDADFAYSMVSVRPEEISTPDPVWGWMSMRFDDRGRIRNASGAYISVGISVLGRCHD